MLCLFSIGDGCAAIIYFPLRLAPYRLILSIMGEYICWFKLLSKETEKNPTSPDRKIPVTVANDLRLNDCAVWHPRGEQQCNRGKSEGNLTWQSITRQKTVCCVDFTLLLLHWQYIGLALSSKANTIKGKLGEFMSKGSTAPGIYKALLLS